LIEIGVILLVCGTSVGIALPVRRSRHSLDKVRAASQRRAIVDHLATLPELRVPALEEIGVNIDPNL
jgi:hypothetical protein